MTPTAARDNKVLDGRILLRQPVNGFRSGSDAVLLAAACHPTRHGKVLELGCGTGSPMLCLGWRRRDVDLTGVEVDAATADMARFNIRRNGMADRARVVTADVAELTLPRGGFDLVLANPPYFTETHHRRSPYPERDRARAEGAVGLEDWVKATAQLLAPQGHAVFILRQERMDDLLTAAAGEGLSAEILPVVGAVHRPPKRALFRLSRNSYEMVKEYPPLFLHHEGGQETALAQNVFRHAAPLFWPGRL